VTVHYTIEFPSQPAVAANRLLCASVLGVFLVVLVILVHSLAHLQHAQVQHRESIVKDADVLPRATQPATRSSVPYAQVPEQRDALCRNHW
jgi:hypothetical protein